MSTATNSLTMKKAAARLGVSNSKMWRLVKEGILPTHENPLDRREKLIRLADLEKLTPEGRPRPRFLSDGSLDAPDAVESDKIEEYLWAHWHPRANS